MKNFYLTILICLVALGTNAQNVLLFQDFESDPIAEQTPVGNDSIWIAADFDFLPDQSGNSLPSNWFLGEAFADADGGTTVLISNSWTEEADLWVSDYLITPPIHLDDNTGELTWKSASRQIPKFLDGLQVLVSKTGNLPEDFTDTLMIYAEYIDSVPGVDIDTTSYITAFNSCTFSSGYITGQDSSYIEYNGDKRRYRGILRPDTASLAAYANKTIYIAFCHGTHDDFLISLDDIGVTGIGTVNVDNIKENLSVSVFPNPATSKINVSYKVANVTSVKLNIFDLTGKLVKAISNTTQLPGNYVYNVDVKDLPAGLYHVQLKSPNGESTVKVTKF